MSAGQHRGGGHRQAAPGHLLGITHLEITGPVVDLAEVQAHPGVWVVEHLLLPGVHGADGDAQFLLQFAPQGLLQRLAGLELAARELPVAGVDLADG